ncbi:hypothetical protein ZIOFF_051762 [Zingiber officinale]|uniref:Uncharacterized protein n=1 Tax=Zingiber officinale TaxID=94328 RepID=A0A8J5G2V1_ZINOF|nr:hypothetical protein ZIOFF_051762 [Zingiber officinale]
MAWWHRVVGSPAKRAWAAVASRFKSSSDGKPALSLSLEASGILNLHNDVQMCGYQDVQTMWELVKRSEMELSHKNKKRKRPLWRLSAWLNRTSCSDPMDPH